MACYNNLLTVVDFNFIHSKRIIIVHDFPNDFAFILDVVKHTTCITTIHCTLDLLLTITLLLLFCIESPYSIIFRWHFFCSSNLECLFKQSSSRRSATAQKLDHNKFADKPGQAWDAKKQCELLLLDNDARVMSTETNLDSSRQQPEVSLSSRQRP